MRFLPWLAVGALLVAAQFQPPTPGGGAKTGGGTTAPTVPTAPAIRSVYEESPTCAAGTCTLAHTPTAGTLRCFLNGMRMKRGLDYLLSGTQVGFSGTNAALATGAGGNVVVCDYEY